MSTAPRGLIDQLDEALERSTADSRLAALWYATDVLLTGRYSEQQIWTFGEIIDLLAADIELKARARLANHLSGSDNAPIQTIRRLALDDAIEVAAPILTNSRRVDDETLIKAAHAKGQLHLRAIAKRKSLSQRVTDVLVQRGDKQVHQSVAGNEGARFSDMSLWDLIRRYGNDQIMILCLGERKDIPRHLFQQLIAKASDEVKERLVTTAPHVKAKIDHIIADIAGEAQAKVGPASKEYFEAKRCLSSMHRQGALGEKQLLEFARAKKFIETTVGLSLLSGVSVDAVERALAGEDTDLILILGKSAGLSWTLVQALLLLSAAKRGVAKHDMDAACINFSRLSVNAARNVIEFFEARRRRPGA